jgi:hypothetical protein
VLLSAAASIRAGLGQAFAAPGLALGLWLVNLVAAVPAGIAVTVALDRSIGPSRVHESLRRGFDMEWYELYRERAQGLAATFTPTVTGSGAFLDNLEGWATGELFARTPALVGLGAAYALVWALVLGGVVDRFARPQARPTLCGFFGAGGRFYVRFLRLAFLSGAAYAGIYVLARRASGWLDTWTRDVTQERVVFAWSILALALTAFLLVLVHAVFAFAKVATVVEDRRSMLLAAAQGFRFVLSNPGPTLGLYFGLTIVSASLLGLYHLAAPGVGQESYGGVALAFFAGQALLVGRVLLRLAFLAGAVTVYSSASGVPAAP